jgi:hypothetical protein
MTTTINSLWSVVWSAVRATAIVPAALCLMQCSAEQATGEEGPENLGSVTSALACGSVACTIVNDCTSAANWPLCAKLNSAQCCSSRFRAASSRPKPSSADRCRLAQLHAGRQANLDLGAAEARYEHELPVKLCDQSTRDEQRQRIADALRLARSEG